MEEKTLEAQVTLYTCSSSELNDLKCVFLRSSALNIDFWYFSISIKYVMLCPIFLDKVGCVVHCMRVGDTKEKFVAKREITNEKFTISPEFLDVRMSSSLFQTHLYFQRNRPHHNTNFIWIYREGTRTQKLFIFWFKFLPASHKDSILHETVWVYSSGDANSRFQNSSVLLFK